MLDYDYDDQGTIIAISHEDDETLHFQKVGATSWQVNRYGIHALALQIQDFPVDHSFDLIDGEADDGITIRNETLEIRIERTDDASAQVWIGEIITEEDISEFLDFHAYVRLRRTLIESVFSSRIPLTLDRVLGGDILFHSTVSTSFYCHELIDIVKYLETEIDKQTKLRIIESLL